MFSKTRTLTIKICGLSTIETLDAALGAGAHMVGFVFFEKSPRHVMLETAQNLSVRVGGKALKVALTVNADDARFAAIIEHLHPDILQLHGSETPERVQAVRARFGLPVMKAIGLSGKEDLAAIPPFEAVADLLLFDAKPPKDAERPGGNGQSFDWTLLRALSVRKPWMLSGGLTIETIGDALAATRAAGIDVSSGVEKAAGIKDEAKIKAFISEALAAAEKLGLAANSV
jgi:phosphoribosylanthranilate isomerase